MSSNNFQNILDNALTEFFSEDRIPLPPLYDICYTSLAFNYLNFDHQNLGQTIGQHLGQEERQGQGQEEGHPEEEEEETKSNSGDSLPDLIPIDNTIMDSSTQQQNPNQQITLWYQLIEDYNAQIHTYQQNIQSIINITENILPIFNNRTIRTRNTNANANTSRQNLITQLRNLFRNNEYTASPYILEFENITPLIFSQTQGQRQTQGQQTNNYLTSQEIQNATDLFINDSRTTLLYNTCPITLEEFREGEPLMRIRHCGHIFKAFELQRWFLRNTKCPSCRYDIRTGTINNHEQ